MPTCQVGVLFVKGFSEVWLGIEVVGISDTPYSVVHSSPLGSWPRRVTVLPRGGCRNLYRHRARRGICTHWSRIAQTFWFQNGHASYWACIEWRQSCSSFRSYSHRYWCSPMECNAAWKNHSPCQGQVGPCATGQNLPRLVAPLWHCHLHVAFCWWGSRASKA